MDSLIWYTGIFRIKSGILESSQESMNPAKIPKIPNHVEENS